MKTLQTARLTLRMFRDDDLGRYATMVNDSEVMRYINGGIPTTRQDAWRHMSMLVGHWHLRGYGMWAVTERDKGQLIGRVGLFNPEGWPGCELGWMLTRDAWGKGYATEAGLAALEWAFTELQHDSVISIIHPDNAASIRVAKRIGEQFDHKTNHKGDNALVYSIVRTAWLAT